MEKSDLNGNGFLSFYETQIALHGSFSISVAKAEQVDCSGCAGDSSIIFP